MSFRLQLGEDSVAASEVSRIAANASSGLRLAPICSPGKRQRHRGEAIGVHRS
ncbi:hypothetical protein [Klebsiella quasipneumoniae]|uniref:hypothetical protein n=1 Tax=Klebsiella quasipneumoniae TaxID=1463165 RepID=UPI001CFD1751|nr:hypothetical protein [Klebsiella quasipneumoniae]